MKRCMSGSCILAVSLLLSMMCVSPSGAVAPYPDGVTTVSLSQAWYNGAPAWYIANSTNDIRFSQTQNITLVPRLTDALPGAAPIYIATNYQQPPVFSASPTGGPNNYSGLWQVYYVTWTTATPRPITNSLPESLANPTGVPTVGATVVATSIVLDYSILVLGNLGGPTYAIPQMVSLNYRTKTAVLPFFYVYCTNPVTKRVSLIMGLILDVEYAPVAALLKGNYAPGLSSVPNPAAQRTWLFTPYPQPGWMMQPPSQYPVTQNCPTSLSWRNSNYDYTPVTNVYFLDRTGASPSSVFNNPTTIQRLLGNGQLTETGITTVNGTIVQPQAG